MATHWIKLEHTTPDKPEIVTLSTLLKIHRDAVVGKLMLIWIWADQHSVDGKDMAVTTAFLDRLTSRKGFCAALRAAGWLDGVDGALTLVNFTNHNGATAKTRSIDNRRKASQRERDKIPTNSNESSFDCPDDTVTENGTRGRGRGRGRVEVFATKTSLAPAGAGVEGIFKNDPQREARFAAMAEIENTVIADLTPAGRSALNKALADIVKASPNVTPDEITRRHKILRRMYPNASMSAMALAKHWARCASMPLDPNSLMAAQKREFAAEAAAYEKAEAEAKAQRTAETAAGMAIFDDHLPAWVNPTEPTKPNPL